MNKFKYRGHYYIRIKRIYPTVFSFYWDIIKMIFRDIKRLWK